MDASTTIYYFHWLFITGALAASWARARHVLHPHFMFTMMFFVYLSDFFVRGYDVNNNADPYTAKLDDIASSDLYGYQISILMAIGIILFLALFVRSQRLERQLTYIKASLALDRPLQLYALVTALFLIAGEIVKRLSTVQWSPMEVLVQSLHARGDRVWDQEAWAGGNFIFAISTIFMPLCGVIAGFLLICARGWIRFAAALVFVAVSFFLVTDGSRTPLAVVAGAMWCFAMFRWRSPVKRAMITGAVCLSIATAFSLMLEYRGVGFESDAQQFHYTYHQDDNYYRTLHSFSVADQSDYRWDPLYFFYRIAVNPIPRAIWSGKPLVEPDFFGDFRLPFTTNFFFGESIAMFGLNAGLVFATLWALLLYLLLYFAFALLSKPLGIAAYLLVTLYIYMCMRSMQNVTTASYLAIAGVATVMAADRIARRRRSRSFVQEYSTLSGMMHDRARPRQV